ncbi:MAG TPA: hypothetical protein QF753_22605 [Victivallales bacterium]|nr:hypothetical protein [Victivallales bacterium]
MELEIAIKDYCNKTKRFTLDDIISHINSKNPKAERLIEDYLEENSLTFIKTEDDEKYYYSRNIFFKNHSFKITISEEEIEKKIIYPGHKFIPFFNSECFPSELKIKAKNIDDYLSTKQVKRKLEKLYRHHSLLGADNIIDYFLTESNSNKDIVGNPNQSVTLSVFDIKDFYKNNNLTDEHELNLTVQDWEKGLLYLSPVRDAFNREEILLWIEIMEEALFKVFQEHGPYIDIYEQLSYTFFYAENPIVNKPLVSIEEFIGIAQNIRLKFVENNTILWYKTDETSSEDEDKNNEILNISQGNIDSINDILDEHKYLLSSVELESYIIDAILNNTANLDEILNKVIPTDSISFKDEAQEIVFKNQVEELWEELDLNIKHDFESNSVTDIRKNILENLDDFYTWYKDNNQVINKNIEKIQSQYSILCKSIEDIRYLLDNLNKKQEKINEEDINQLQNISNSFINKLEESVELIKNMIK